MVERLKKEEEERIARRKRVEAIMKRTRGGNNQANTPTKVRICFLYTEKENQRKSYKELKLFLFNSEK